MQKSAAKNMSYTYKCMYTHLWAHELSLNGGGDIIETNYIVIIMFAYVSLEHLYASILRIIMQELFS